MENNDKSKEKNGFSYNYSAREQAEIKKIRERYGERAEEEHKLARLRRLDRSVTSTAEAISLAIGVIGALILGLGMSLFMSELGATLGLGKSASLLVGISTGVIGCLLCAMAYPVYNLITRRMRQKLAPEIIRLADELLK